MSATPLPNQMVNCFDANHCGNTSGPSNYNQGEWHGIVGSKTAVANGISPDEMAGATPAAGDTYDPTGGSGSIWAGTTATAVQWNAAGTVYGCWD